ncbi:MAG: helix-turn-helix domain-containing protein [Bacteroidota bacterium]
MPVHVATWEDIQKIKEDMLNEISQLIQERIKPPSKTYLKSSEVKSMLKISNSTLQTLRVNGTLSFSKVGGIILYDKEEIIKIIEENRVTNNY